MSELRKQKVFRHNFLSSDTDNVTLVCVLVQTECTSDTVSKIR